MPNATGRPTLYTPELARYICRELADGRSLRSVCTDDGMPDRSTVYDWLDADTHGFTDQYARARARQADTFLDEIIEIADDNSGDVIDTERGPIPNTEFIARSKTRIDSRKWFMSKVAPKKYGDSKSLDVTSGGERITGFQIIDFDGDSPA